MNGDPYEKMKAACGLVDIPGGGQGTAYLIGKDQAVTCEHVVRKMREGEAVEVSFGAEPRSAIVGKKDEAGDCALLQLDRQLTNVEPLPLAGRCTRKALWEGFGFVGLANRGGLPLDGEVADPESVDDQGHPALLLYSDKVAAGMASPLHGFSGSPVLVQGKVVGHIKRTLSDPDDPKRPAFGMIYAVPSRIVLKMLGIAPAVEQVDPPPVCSLKDLIPALAQGDYHAFVSYRSSDRPFALALANRLEGAGFRIFLDQRELVPGEALANSLQAGLARSHAGIVLLSRGWLDAPWCQQEGNALLTRATQERGFRVVPLRLDDSPLPPLWAGYLYIDFAGQTAPQGENLSRVMWALLGRTPPPESAQARIVQAEQGSTDKLLQELQAAAGVNANRVYRLWQTWLSAGLPPSHVSLMVAQRLLSFAHTEDWALEVLQTAGDGIRAQQLRALALKRSGRRDEALEILRGLYGLKQVDPETAGMLAAIYKRDFLDNNNDRGALIASYDLYRSAFDRTGDTYVGINAAALALWSGAKDEARQLAGQLMDALGRSPEEDLDHWQLATKAEALLLLGQVDEARQHYLKTIAKIPGWHTDIGIMRMQARVDLEHLGLKRDALDDALPVPRIAAFSGHMTDAPERAKPRFPASKQREVRLALREKLKVCGVGIGFSSAARGGDLLFLEELLARGGQAFVYLPFDRDSFLNTSVGAEWKDRYQQILGHPHVKVTELSKVKPGPAEEQDAYKACNDRIRTEAINLGRQLEEPPVVITVWDGEAGERGGTGEAVRAWRDQGYEPENVDPTTLKA